MFYTDSLIGQDKFIVFKYDTLKIYDYDSIYYKLGDELNGEVKYGSNGYYDIAIIKDGFITRITYYRKDSKKWMEWNYQNRLLNGEYNEWNENGKLICRGFYKNHYEDSLWTSYYSTGEKESEGYFIADTLNLIPDFVFAINSNEDYIPKSRITKTRLASPPDGEWKFYNKAGKRIKTFIFDKGIIKYIEVGDHIDEDN